MKYDYNSNIKDVVLVTDDKERIKPRMTRFFLKLLRNNGLNPIATKHFYGDQVRKNKKFYFHRDRKIFKKSFEYLTEPVSVQTLINFSMQNPELQKDLKEDPSYFMKILWQEYQKRFHQSDRLHEIVEHYEVGQKFAAKFPDAHILTVLFFHKVISPKLQSNGTLNYHSVGRGFYGYGACKPIEPLIGSPGRAKILITVNAASN
jgi:hypothetical protein